jgi:uncharacterized repeat protein (TIGR01451 family)
MKKLILLFLVLVLKFASTKAQWVTIPDANFATFLQQIYPNCMNGNQMDTTCAGIVNETYLSVSLGNISDLTGLEYFTNLQYLVCQSNNLTNLPSLPSSLIYLDISDNNLTNLPILPNTLEDLRFSSNQISILFTLPDSLKSIDCSWNSLTTITSLPIGLINLACFSNQLIQLPELPETLKILDCNYNLLTALPTLPSTLQHLICHTNLISSLPDLPNSLFELNCGYNDILALPILPDSLLELFCYYNDLTNLPILPSSLSRLSCTGNQLASLPILPSTLTELSCSSNQLTFLPELPNSLFLLDCAINQLTELQQLPDSLIFLTCQSNLLNSLPRVPIIMSEFRINSNNISCLVNLPQVSYQSYGNISNNPLTCVPNQTSYSLGLPLCLENDPINNPNNCPSVNIIGKVFKDLNANCTYNPTDLHSQNIPVKLYDNQDNFLAQSYTINGVYSFSTLLPDTFQVKIDTTNLPIAMACGQNSAQSVTLDSANQTIQNINFPLVCNAEYDVYVQSVSSQGWVFPGQTHTLETNVTNNSNWYNLNCSSTIVSGTISIQVNGPVSFVAPAAGALIPIVSGNTFTYSISDFNTLIPTSFGLSLLTDTTAQANDQICVHVEISPNPIDADTTNNVYDFCYNVVNSYDPNMKEVYPVNVLPGYDDWFTYTIHFQNTGNAPAFNIRLRDTLDTQLDLNTFEVLGYSHPVNVTVSGNILTVRFNNIMLPDSTSDYEGSMGYFQYRIKPTSNLPNGSQISNTAYIYFDFNAPIITNTTENNFDITVSATNLKLNPESFEIYPNPSTGIFTFKDAKNIQRVEVYNVMGQEIAVFVGDNTNKVSKQINLSNYSKGIYFAKINGSVVLKLVKE